VLLRALLSLHPQSSKLREFFALVLFGLSVVRHRNNAFGSLLPPSHVTWDLRARLSAGDKCRWVTRWE
jgi:hypothetical protein